MIVACPCTVALSIPFTLGNILRILGRHRFYLKNITVVEAFSAIHTVVLDKTGTITNIAQQTFNFHGKQLNFSEKTAIRSLTRHSSHPLSRKIYDMLDVPVEKPDWFEELPGRGIRGKVADLQVLIGSAEFMHENNLPNPYPNQSGVFVSINQHIIGFYEVKSRYRDGLAEVLQYFRQKLRPLAQNSAAPTTWLLSGDHDKEADRLAPFFLESDTMLFQQSPQGKLDFIKNLQQSGQKVLMLGDGLNDAGALRQSDLGIVVAENTNNFTPACDAIIHADEFGNLPAYAALARDGVKIVHWSYAVALTYNIIGLSFAVTGDLSPLIAAILMPISSISIVLFGVGMSNWKARNLPPATKPS
jgi:Cu+-exporting ATPase